MNKEKALKMAMEWIGRGDLLKDGLPSGKVATAQVLAGVIVEVAAIFEKYLNSSNIT